MSWDSVAVFLLMNENIFFSFLFNMNLKFLLKSTLPDMTLTSENSISQNE